MTTKRNFPKRKLTMMMVMTTAMMTAMMIPTSAPTPMDRPPLLLPDPRITLVVEVVGCGIDIVVLSEDDAVALLPFVAEIVALLVVVVVVVIASVFSVDDEVVLLRLLLLLEVVEAALVCCDPGGWFSAGQPMGDWSQASTLQHPL